MFTGAVGDDDLAEKLKEFNRREGLDQVYQVKKGGKTGACAVIITGHLRYVSSYHVILYIAPYLRNFFFFFSDLLLPICVLPTSSRSSIYCPQKSLPWWRA